MIDKEVFSKWFTILSERFRQSFSGPTIAVYYEFLGPKLSTEQFEAVARYLFGGDGSSLPSPPEIVSLARTLVPDPALPEAPLPKLYCEMTPAEQANYRQVIDCFRAMLVEVDPKFAKFGAEIIKAAVEGGQA
ncbi:hypothetical protein H6F43_04260 [Leptolyngbya sp. FACHB-36]|uniref:hypothetical protein n=1 Tax=Leptolyngbya sp. FACHB-36 TaxID=2692808 RepID=UPI00168195D6|nr:hypothetical protein [Leptolyngbya sp. FACHB-36]MBD2019397.1 hypothetical protein [Leptolyngbya sp. FACHB-36]